MRKYFKQLLQSNDETGSFNFNSNINGKNGLVFNATVERVNDIKISLAYLEIKGLQNASNLSFYWDETGELTDFANLDTANGVEKLDCSATSNATLNFDVTKVFVNKLEKGKLQTNTRFILAGNNIPTSGVSCALYFYYDYKFGKMEGTATVPFELKTANGYIDLSEGSLHMSYVANQGYGRLPATIKFIYDSNSETAGGKVYLDNNQSLNIRYCVCRGWKLNFNQYIVYEKSEDDENAPDSNEYFLSDNESVGFLTWINAQGNQILFKERFYAEINNMKTYLDRTQVEAQDDGTYIYMYGDHTYYVTHEFACDKLFNMEEVNGKIIITDIAKNKMTFEFCGTTKYKGVTVYHLTRIENSYAISNAINLEYNALGLLSKVTAVGGNTVTFEYDEDTDILLKMIDKVGNEKSIEISINEMDDCIYGFITPEGNRDMSFTYNGETNLIETALDAIGNGYYLESNDTSREYGLIYSIAKNKGVINGAIEALIDTKNTINLNGVRYKKINLYEISYGTRYAILTELRNNKSSNYIFDYFGRNINTYTNNYDGEGNGNPQSESFALNEPAVEINSQNVFGSNDLCFASTCNSPTAVLENISNATERYLMSDFYAKMKSLSEQNKNINTNIYYQSGSKNCSIDFNLSDSAVSTMKNSDSDNYVLSGWAMAKAFPMISLATGYDIINDNSSEFRYNVSTSFNEFYLGLGTNRAYRTFNLYVKINYGTRIDTFMVSFDYNNPNFQQLQVPVVLRHKDKSKIQSVTVGVNYDNNNGTVYLYGLSMKSCNWNLTQYDEYKLMRFSANKDKEDYWTEYSYYKNHLLKTVVTTKMSSADSLDEKYNENVIDYTVDYTYDSHNSILKTVDSKGFVVEYEYNGYGDVLNKKSYRQLEESETTRSLEEKATYDNVTGFEIKDYSPIGELANTYVYENGVLKTVTPACSATILYNYDSALNLVTEMTAQVPNNPITSNQDYFNGESIKQYDYGTNVKYDYDGFGRVIKIYLDNEEYCSVEYVSEREKIVTYSNGEREKINMNKDDTHADIYQTDNPNNWGSTSVEMTFSKYGGFKQLEDNISGTKIKASYDDRGLPSKTAVENKGDHFYDVIIKNEYDQTGRVTCRTYEQENKDIEECNYYYQKGYNGKLTGISHYYIDDEKITYDDLERVSRYSKSGDDLYVDYTYVNGNNNTTSNLVESEKFTSYVNENYLDKYDYSYDALGRLTEVKNNDTITKKYHYDLVGRLIREDNKDFDKTFEFVYDNAGNILKRNEYAYTEGVLPVVPVATFDYAYDTTHKNRLISYNGEECSNYVLGNPKTYRGHNLTWTKVHRLASFDNVSYEYDYAGIRTKKIVNGVTTKYGINGSTIVSQETSTVENGVTTIDRLTFFQGYDGVTGFQHKVTKTEKGADGKDVVLSVNTSNYNYKKNIFGDVIGIYNEDDKLVVKYSYDAWGNSVIIPSGEFGLIGGTVLADFIGNLNPYRYRSYYFDVETGLYYLQSRYYDPKVGRFISMDQVEYLAPDVVNGLNLYVYCLNNPVMSSDPEGTWPDWKKLWRKITDVAVTVVAATVGAVVGAAAGIATCVAVTAATGGNLFLGVAAGVTVGVVVGSASTGVVNNVANAIYYNNFSNGQSNLSPTSYSGSDGEKSEYLNRWDRLDYAKQKTGEKSYNSNAWRYYSEYTMHMVMWNMTQNHYTGKKGDGFLSDIAYRSREADLWVDKWDTNIDSTILTVLFGILGY